MQISKAGIASLVAGIVILALSLVYGFGGDAMALLVSGLVLGGIAWLGIVLLVLGILIILV